MQDAFLKYCEMKLEFQNCAVGSSLPGLQPNIPLRGQVFPIIPSSNSSFFSFDQSGNAQYDEGPNEGCKNSGNQ